MSEFSYYTVSAPAEGLFKEKGSKFLSFVYPVHSEEEIKAKLENLKKKYFDARHHCFAWMLGADKKSFRVFDDGEPNHSAGDPILGQIRSKGLTNVLVVVVRYFGGVKLGVGGLISAYKTAAEEALNNAVIIETEVTEEGVIHFHYSSTSDVMKVVKDLGLKVIGQQFGDECHLRISLPLRHKVKVQERLDLMKAMGKYVEWKIQVAE
jgi:uncharacterized YigZ family protein